MLASTVDVPLANADFVYEPKYDGVRTIALVAPGRPVPDGPPLVARSATTRPRSSPPSPRRSQPFRAEGCASRLLLDGEIVALDERGEPVGFQHLQGRIHRKHRGHGRRHAVGVHCVRPAARRPARPARHAADRAARRARTRLRQSRLAAAAPVASRWRSDGRELYREAIAEGWEGLIAKRAVVAATSPASAPPTGPSSSCIREQEFVVGGWTEPRGTRTHFGALLLGVYDDEPSFVYVAHVGSGFNEAELARVMTRADAARDARRRPFDVPPPATNETPHWVKPQLVAQVKFTEWTDEGRLRHPTYLGLRDDVKPHGGRSAEGRSQYEAHALAAPPDEAPRSQRRRDGANGAKQPRSRTRSKPTAAHLGTAGAPALPSPSARRRSARTGLEDAPQARARSRCPTATRSRSAISHKVFWPDRRLTKGDLLRYYVRVSPFILPVVAGPPAGDEALSQRRRQRGVLPASRARQGATGRPHRYAARRRRAEPAGRRIAEDAALPDAAGGDLEDPWFSRVRSLQIADHVAFDLDPMPGTSFDDGARRRALAARRAGERVGAVGVPEDVGLRRPARLRPACRSSTPYEAGRIWAQIVATMVATKHPKVATVERTRAASAARRSTSTTCRTSRARRWRAPTARAPASLPASPRRSRGTKWIAGVDRRDFTIATLPARLAEVGDLWKPLFTAKAPKLEDLAKKLK